MPLSELPKEQRTCENCDAYPCELYEPKIGETCASWKELASDVRERADAALAEKDAEIARLKAEHRIMLEEVAARCANDLPRVTDTPQDDETCTCDLICEGPCVMIGACPVYRALKRGA